MNRKEINLSDIEKQNAFSNPLGPQRILVINLDPIKILQTMSEEDYEIIIEEWQRDYLGKKFARVERLGGTGDKGRDVVCTLDNGDWINYQCKHYDHKLTKANILPEIGKCCYYCFKRNYSPPKKYYFVSPLGVVTGLRDLLKSHEKLKNELISNWNKQCRNKIVSTYPIDLSGELLDFVREFNFEIFDYVSESDFLEEFRKTPHYTKRFGLLCKPRPLIENAPAPIQPTELNYIQKILDAYSDYLKKDIDDVVKLHEYPDLENDFNRQRLYFYSAEYLGAYSRETYAPELQCFERLKDDIYHSIIEEIEDDAKNGFERLRKVLKRAEALTVNGNLLNSEINVKDKKGLCHHLANERDDVKWIK